jgi:hypothetical protein
MSLLLYLTILFQFFKAGVCVVECNKLNRVTEKSSCVWMVLLERVLYDAVSATELPPPPQCHHMSLMDFVVSPPGFG